MAMGFPVGFDLDVLRSFVAIAEEGSFTRAAARVGRTQSAVSFQMQRLEGVLGQTVIVRSKGGSVKLNQEGRCLLGRARELLELNDDFMRSMHATPVHGTIRLGIAAELPLSAADTRSLLADRARCRGRGRHRDFLPVDPEAEERRARPGVAESRTGAAAVACDGDLAQSGEVDHLGRPPAAPA